MDVTKNLNFFGIDKYNDYLNLRHCGYDFCGPNQSSGPRVCNYFLIHFIFEGKGIYTTHQKTYHLGVGDAFLIRPGDIIYYSSDAEDPWHFCFFAFDGLAANELIEQTKFYGSNCAIHNSENSALTNLIDETLDVLREKSSNFQLYATTQLMRMLQMFEKESNSEIVTNNSIKHDLVRTAVDYINLHFADDVSISTLSEILSANRSYLCRIFKKETGLTPKEYLTHCRMEIARRMILESELPISDISAACGYVSFSSFFKTFQAFYNASPKKYKNLHSSEF